jgi:hypothetical protein
MTNIIHPLAWPVQRPRTRRPEAAAFRQRGKLVLFEQGVQRVVLELSRVTATNVTITSNKAPRGFSWLGLSEDTGAAVYFRLNGNPHCLSCDRWDRIADNLCAIAKHCEAIRGQVRWGVADLTQIFAGFKELPAPAAQKPWWTVLGFAQRPASRAEIVVKYHELARLHHPDKDTGNVALMQEINAAYETGLAATP